MAVFALFALAEEARRAAKELEKRGAGPMQIETEANSATTAIQPSPRTSWASLAGVAICTVLLALLSLCVPGTGYVLALISLITLLYVRPAELEHRLLVRDQTLATGGAVLRVSPGALRAQTVMRVLQSCGAIDFHHDRRSEDVGPETL